MPPETRKSQREQPLPVLRRDGARAKRTQCPLDDLCLAQAGCLAQSPYHARIIAGESDGEELGVHCFLRLSLCYEVCEVYHGASCWQVIEPSACQPRARRRAMGVSRSTMIRPGVRGKRDARAAGSATWAGGRAERRQGSPAEAFDRAGGRAGHRPRRRGQTCRAVRRAILA